MNKINSIDVIGGLYPTMAYRNYQHRNETSNDLYIWWHIRSHIDFNLVHNYETI